MSALCVVSAFVGVGIQAGPVLVRPFDVLVGIGFFLLLGRASVKGRVSFVSKSSSYYLFIITYAYRCINGFFFSGVGITLKESIQFIEFLVFIHLVAEATRSEERRRRFMRVLLIGSGVASVLVALWHIGHGYYAEYKQLGPPKLFFSLFGFLAVAGYLIREKDRRLRGIVVFGAVLLVLLSGERKGWVALVAAIGAIYVALNRGSIWRIVGALLQPRYVLGGMVVVGTGMGVALQFEQVQTQLRNLYDVYVLLSNLSLQMDLTAFETSGSNLARLYMLLFAIRTTMAHPFFGVGTGKWLEALKSAAGSDSAGYVLRSHSEFQKFAVENGLTGLVLYVSIWIAAFSRALRLARGNTRSVRESALMVLGMTVFGAFINLFLGGGALNIVYLALPVGLLVGLENDDEVRVRSA
jgi:O-antigen ligase